MSSMSDYMEAKCRSFWLRGESVTQPTTIYVAALTEAAVDSDTGSTLSEPVGNGYARVALTANTTNFTAASSSNGISTNGVSVTWTASGGSWGDIVGVALCDAATSGNMLMHTTITTKTIGDGDSLTVPIGSLSITFA